MLIGVHHVWLPVLLAVVRRLAAGLPSCGRLGGHNLLAGLHVNQLPAACISFQYSAVLLRWPCAERRHRVAAVLGASHLPGVRHARLPVLLATPPPSCCRLLLYKVAL